MGLSESAQTQHRRAREVSEHLREHTLGPCDGLLEFRGLRPEPDGYHSGDLCVVNGTAAVPLACMSKELELTIEQCNNEICRQAIAICLQVVQLIDCASTHGVVVK